MPPYSRLSALLGDKSVLDAAATVSENCLSVFKSVLFFSGKKVKTSRRQNKDFLREKTATAIDVNKGEKK